MKKLLLLLTVALVVLIQAVPVFAQEHDDDWKFYVAPALWAANVESTLQAGSITVSDEVGFGDIVKNLRGGLMGGYGARYNKFSIDGAVLAMGLKAELPAVIGALGSRTTEVTQFWQQLLFGYDLLDVPIGDTMNLKYKQQIGPRYYYNRILIDRLKITGGGEFRDASSSWVDFVVGGVFTLDLNDKWSLIANGDTGGFGWGSSSDKAWSVGGFIDYRKSDRSTIRVGYKEFHLEKASSFSLGEINLDLKYSGPVFQWIFNF